MNRIKDSKQGELGNIATDYNISLINCWMNRVFYEFYIFNGKDKLLFYMDFENLKESDNSDPSLGRLI